MPMQRFNQTFETGTAGFAQNGSGSTDAVASGTNGIPSRDGNAHGLITGAGSFTRFDGYRSDFGGGFTTGVSVYIDPNWAAGEGFEWSVAANGQDGNHQRDFIFQVTSDSSTGALLVGVSNGSNFVPNEGLENQAHFEITDAGWYTLEHVFSDGGDGTLVVTMNVIDAGGATVFSQALNSGLDLIATEVGGNRYGWFTTNTVSGGLAVDGVTLVTADTNPFTVHDGNNIVDSYATEAEAIAAAEAGDGLAVRENGVAGATFYVTAGESIQDAINAAAPGDTIMIAAGTYAENLVINTDGLDIVAADGAVLQGTFRTDNGITGSTAEFFETSESYSNVSGSGLTVSGDNVTITGLTISGFNTGVELGNGVDGLTLTNVDLSDGVSGIRKGTAAGVTDLTINGGSISEFAYGMNFAKAVADGVGNIDGFVVDGTSFFNLTEKGIYTETLLNALITNITMTDVGVFGRGLAFTPTTGGEHGAGIDINLKYETGLYTNIIIENFDFTNVGESTGPSGTPHGNAGAITIKQRDDGPSYNSDPADFIGSVIIRNGSVGGTSVGVRAGEAGKTVGGPSVTIENVDIGGALVGSVENLTTSPMSVEGSAGNDVIVATAASTGVITFDGAGGADNMTGGGGNDVFAAQGDDTVDGGAGMDTVMVADLAAAQGLTATNVELITVGADAFFVLEGMSIQAAINAASAGDTIYLGAGTFTGNIALNKDVTLVGADGAATTIAGVINVTADGATIDGLHITGGYLFGPDMGVHVAADDVTITNSVIEGAGTAQSAGVTTSYGSTVTGLTLSDNLIEGWVYGAYFNPSVQLAATGNTFDNNTNAGIAIDNPLPGSSISDNTFTATGGGLGLGATTEAFDASDVVGANTFVDQDGQTVVGIYAYGTLLGGAFTTQTVTGTGQNDYMSGEWSTGVTDQVFDGGAGDDEIEAFGGDDVLIGGAGSDSLDGGLGFDAADYSDDAEGIVVDLAAGTVTGGAGVGSDTLSGIEIVRGGAGDDAVTGGVGVDGASFQTNGSLSTESFTLGADGVWTVTGDGTDTLDGVEQVRDGAGNLFLLVGGNAFPTVQAALDSGLGGTLVVGSLPEPDPEPVEITFDADDIAPTAPGEEIEILGSDAFDTLDITVEDLGPGEITVTGDPNTGLVSVDLDGDGTVDLTFSGIEEVVLNGSRIVLGGNFTGTGVSNDTIVMNGTSGNDILDGSAVMSTESQEAYGYEGNDTIDTAGGDDYVDAGAGSDNVETRGGNDVVIGNADGVSDVYDGGADVDTIDYSADTDGVNVNLASASASGLGIGNDIASGFENVIGGSGDDSLIGNGANNRIVGGLGADDIRGLNGTDTAVINAAAVNGIATQLGGGRLELNTADGSDVIRTTEFIEFNNGVTVAVNSTTGNAHAWGGADTDAATEGASGAGDPATGNVLTNDIEIEGEAVTVTGVAAGAESGNAGLTTGGVGASVAGTYGSLTLNADGSYSYVVTNQTLGAGETATDTFTYRVADGVNEGDLTTITFTVSGENDAPVIGVADGDAAVTESSITVSDTGSIAFSDLDATDDLTVSDDSATTAITWDGGTLSGGQEAAIRAGFTLDDTSFDNSGTVNWTYSASAADLDFLAAGETVTFDVTVTVTDDSGEMDNSASTVVSVTITGANDAPTVTAISGAATNENDTAYELNLLTDASAADVDQTDVLSVDNVTAGSSNLGRTVVFDVDLPTGAFSMDATQFNDLAAGESETITVSYEVVDGNGGVTANTATFVVNGVNDAPVVTPITAADITEDDANPYSLDLLANASDADASDDLDVDNVSAASSNLGRSVAFLVNEETGELTLDPDQFDDLAVGESETITVTYDVIDGQGGVTPTTATFVVNGVNDDPVGGDDSPFQMNENTGGTIDTADLLANDADDDTSDTLTVTAVASTSANGALLTLNGDGTITYDSNGQFEYLAVGESTTDTFTYTVDDGNGGTDEATVTVTVNGVNDVPVGGDDAGSVAENGPAATGNVLTNDTDADTSDTLAVVSVNGSGMNVGSQITLASGALLTVNADGSYSYDPNGQFEDLADGETTTDSFEYDASDSNGGFTGATTVTLTITGSNDGPTVGAAVTATVSEDDVSVGIDLLDGAADVDNGAELSVVDDSVTQTGGTAFDLSGFVYDIDANGQLTFDADQFDSLGEDDDIELTFSYDVSDENGATVSQTAVVTIAGENDDPAFVDPNATPAAFDENDSLVADGSFAFDGTDRTDTHTASASLDSATVSGGGSLTVAQQNALAAAMSALVNGSSVEWDFDASAADFNSLNPGQNVTATYTVTVDDGEGGTDTRTVTVTINGDYERQTAPDGGGTITGTNLADEMTGSSDDDTIHAGGGNNLVNGGDGDDTVTAGSGADTINGGGGDDIITSGSGNDTIDGGGGDDDINAGSGDDFVFSSLGDDTLRGGSGVDTVSFQNAGAGITLTLMSGGVQVTGQGEDIYQGFENVIGSDFNDTLIGNGLANTLTGGLGADTLDGGLGNDTLIGGAGNDTYYTDAGDTVVELAGGGADRVFTSAAVYTVGGNIENVYGQSAGGHAFTGDDGANILVGAGGNDVLIGGLGGDTLLGQAGNDTLVGGTGVANTLQGGLGDDVYVVDANDSVVELASQGTDRVETTRSTYTLGSNVENLTFTGAGAFTGTGNVLSNTIIGGSGNDTLMGGAGNDSLNGGDGTDVARVSGQQAGYSVVREGAGWRITDTNLGDGDDGSDFVVNMETLRFGNGSTMSLVIPEPAPLLTGGKGEFDGPQVLPALADDDFLVFAKDAGPQVMPGSDVFDDGLFGSLMQSGGKNTLHSLSGELLLQAAPADEGLFHDIGRHDDWMM